MSEQSWLSVLRNRAEYPDDMTVDMNGTPIALGDLRNSVIPKEDMTRLTQGWSQRDQAAQARIEQLSTQLATALTAANHQDAAANTYEGNAPGRAHGSPLIDYERDPILGPIMDLARHNADRQARTEAVISKLETTLQGIGAQLGQWPVMMALDQIKRNDPYNVDPQALVQHALSMRQGPPNLNESYMALTREHREAAIRKQAEEEAYAKAKRELAIHPVPYHPFGPPQTVRSTEPTYATLDEAEVAASADPEMLAILMGQT